MTNTTTEKTRETRMRRMAERQGLRLVKSRRRDPRAIDYGRYMLKDVRGKTGVLGLGGSDGGLARPQWTLDDVEEFLTGEGG